MYVVCQKSKYGFCKYGKRCDKIYFTDICEKNNTYEETYCDKRLPVMCSYFETYGKCKFGVFCDYTHSKRIDNDLERDVEILKRENCDLKASVRELKNKLETLSMSDTTVVHIISVEENLPELSETVETIDKIDFINVDLQTPIKETNYNTNLEKEDIPPETEKETVKFQETSEKNPNIDITFDNLIRENSWLYCNQCSFLFKVREGFKITHC